jgi:hypothetical protein
MPDTPHGNRPASSRDRQRRQRADLGRFRHARGAAIPTSVLHFSRFELAPGRFAGAFERRTGRRPTPTTPARGPVGTGEFLGLRSSAAGAPRAFAIGFEENGNTGAGGFEWGTSLRGPRHRSRLAGSVLEPGEEEPQSPESIARASTRRVDVGVVTAGHAGVRRRQDGGPSSTSDCCSACTGQVTDLGLGPVPDEQPLAPLTPERPSSPMRAALLLPRGREPTAARRSLNGTDAAGATAPQGRTPSWELHASFSTTTSYEPACRAQPAREPPAGDRASRS